jgi:hypothetical protein
MTGSEPRPRKRKWMRRLVIIGAALSTLLITVAYLLPYLLKNYVEKHSEEWIGRRITIDRIVLNPFTFTYGVHGFTCYEPKSEHVFVSWEELSVKADLLSGWRNNAWRFRKARLVSPYFNIVQQGERFNFTDLIELGGPADTATADTSSTVFSIEDIRISDGGVDYSSDLVKGPQGIRALNVNCTRISSESARMEFKLAFDMLKGGALKGGFTIDTERSAYAINAHMERFALPQLLPYLQDFMHTTSLKGEVDLDLDLQDSWAQDNALAVRAALDLQGLQITDGTGEPLIGLRTAMVRLDTLSAKDDRFALKHVLVDGLNTRFEMWADGSNTWSKALKLAADSVTGDSSISLAASSDNVFVMLAGYIRQLGEDLVANEYNADSLVFTNATLQFNDFTPERPFRYELSDLHVASTRFNSGQGSVDFSASAMLNGKGRLSSVFKFDPHNFKNVDATLTVSDLVLPELDPYGRWYAAHPMLNGSLGYESHTVIQEGMLDSKNHFVIEQMKVGKKVEAHDTGIYVLPLRLAVSLLKDVKGNIDIDVPIAGNVKDPSFRPWPIVWQVLKNLVVKAATAPGRLVVRAAGGGDEDLDGIHFELLQSTLSKEQIRALEDLAKGLSAKTDLTVALIPLVGGRMEEEELAAFELKKEFLGYKAGLTAEDSSRILALSTRDVSFAGFLDQRSPATQGLAERERCMAAFGKEAAAARCAALEEARARAVMERLRALGLSAPRVSMRTGTAAELAGAQGRPGYKFVFDAADTP